LNVYKNNGLCYLTKTLTVIRLPRSKVSSKFKCLDLKQVCYLSNFVRTGEPDCNEQKVFLFLGLVPRIILIHEVRTHYFTSIPKHLWPRARTSTELERILHIIIRNMERFSSYCSQFLLYSSTPRLNLIHMTSKTV
jgi:hypothetical protein